MIFRCYAAFAERKATIEFDGLRVTTTKYHQLDNDAVDHLPNTENPKPNTT
ncbi:hypothetical protein RRSWK_05821 [Rhodopirellula sp. SWK7]|nr:hypothetical protein RRSWK_05821 [Rhodopirellula sp. SWK7]